MNGSSNLDETDREYSLAPTDDLIIYWKSKVKVTAGRQGGGGTHVDAGASKSYPSSIFDSHPHFTTPVLPFFSGGLAVQVGWLGLRVGGHLGAESAFIK